MGVWAATRALVRSCHPEPTAAVTGLFTAFAASTGRGPRTAWVTSAVLAGQLSVGWSNDYLDRHRDVRTSRPDKPIAAGVIDADTVAAAAWAALVASVPLSFASGKRAAVAHLAGVAAAWGYNLGLKRTVFSPVPYAIGFGGLPAFVVLGLDGHPTPPAWLIAAGSLLGMGAHFANVLPDLEDDIRTGVRGLPHRLGAPTSAVLAAVLLLAASLLLAFGPGRPGPGMLAAVALGVLALLVAAAVTIRRPGSRAAFRVTILVALLDAALLLLRGSAVS